MPETRKIVQRNPVINSRVISYEVKRLRVRREHERRYLNLHKRTVIVIPARQIQDETYSEHQAVEEHSANIEQLPPLAQIEFASFEVIRRHRQAQQRDQSI